MYSDALFVPAFVASIIMFIVGAAILYYGLTMRPLKQAFPQLLIALFLMIYSSVAILLQGK